MEQKDLILDHKQIQHKITRIAYQVYETYVDESEVIIAGVNGNGYTFASKIVDQLKAISNLDVKLCKVNIDKKNPLNSVSTDLPAEEYTNKAIVIADDVLNTGSTLIYAVHHFLNVPLKKIKTTVLVNRNHKNFPIKADFKGISLSTSSHNTIKVEFNENDAAYLI